MNVIASEVIVFFEACILGVFFGAFYDVFRIIRLSFKNPKLLIFFEDLLYFIVLTIASFIMVVMKNDGFLRSFLIIGELLGMILYFFSISIVVIKSANLIIKMVKNALNFIYKITLKPVIALFCYIMSNITIAFNAIKNKIKNISSKSEIHLK